MLSSFVVHPVNICENPYYCRVQNLPKLMEYTLKARTVL